MPPKYIPEPSLLIEPVVAIAIAAGKEILHYYQGEYKVENKPNNSPVTEADICANDMIVSALGELEPPLPIVSEEMKLPKFRLRSKWRHFWLIDPIDGTVPFTYGLDTWGISIGYMQGGALVEGCLYIPASATCIVSQGSEVYALTHDPASPPDAGMLTPLQRAAGFAEHGVVSISQDLACHGTLDIPYSVQSIGSCVSSVVCYLLGKYRAMITNVKLWDIAGGIPLLEKSGSAIISSRGAAIKGDNLQSAFRITLPEGKEQGQYSRWGIEGHIFVAESASNCHELIAATHYPAERPQ